MAIYLTEGEISQLLTMDETLSILDELFRARARGEIINKPDRKSTRLNSSHT